MQEEKSQSTSGTYSKCVVIFNYINYMYIPNNNCHYYVLDTQPIEPAPGWQEHYVLCIDSYNKLR